MGSIKQWMETRSGLSGGTTLSGSRANDCGPNLTSVKLFRGYEVMCEGVRVRFDREHYGSYEECRRAAEEAAT